MQYTIGFEKLGMGDVEVVGGKNASLGEMISNLAGRALVSPVDLPQLQMLIGSFWPLTIWPVASRQNWTPWTLMT